MSAETLDARLLTFESAGDCYALPIAWVMEVAESPRIACIPTLSGASGGAMNLHGNVLPVVASDLLLTPEGAKPSRESALSAEFVVVVCDRPGGNALFGLPIVRVLWDQLLMAPMSPTKTP